MPLRSRRYRVRTPRPKIDANVSVFKSSSLQRPNSKSDVPGPNHYYPNIKSIHPATGDGGASMRSEPPAGASSC